MTKILAAMAALAVATVGCKGETKYRDSPETASELQKCHNLANEKQKFITTLEAELAALKQKCGEEVVINVAGDGTLKVSGGPGPSRVTHPENPAGNAADMDLYKAFLAKVNGSKGLIKKCYQNALKKDSSLQASDIVLHITVKYHASGKIAGVNFDKGISDTFTGCMEAVTAKWKLPAAPRAYTFKTPVTLTPK